MIHYAEDVRYALLTVREGSVGQPSPFMKEEDILILLNTLDLQGPRDDQGGAAAIISAAKHLKWVLESVASVNHIHLKVIILCI